MAEKVIIGNAELWHGDCREVLPLIENADIVVTSPPYNLGTSPGGQFGHWKDGGIRGGNGAWGGVAPTGIDYGTTDALPHDVYREQQQRILRDCYRIVGEAGAIFYVHKPRPQRDGLLMPTELNPGIPLRQIVIWDRGSGFNRTPTYFVPSHEWVMVLAGPKFRIATRNLDDVWRFPPDAGNTHPAPFPVALPERAITASNARSVLDPYMGSGSTGVAARNCGAVFIGIERERRWFDVACERIARAQAQGQFLPPAPEAKPVQESIL
jgi:modification methylase